IGTANERLLDAKVEPAWFHPPTRDRYMPYYVWALVHQWKEGDKVAQGRLVAFLTAARHDRRPIPLDADYWGGIGGAGSIGGGGGGDGAAAAAAAAAAAMQATTTKWSWLRQHMPAELAYASLLQGDWGAALQELRLCQERFLERWSSLHVCATAARRQQLQALQRVVELEDLLTFRDRPANLARPAAAVAALLSRWSGQRPSATLDPMPVWTTLLAQREEGLHRLLQEVKPWLPESGAAAAAAQAAADAADAAKQAAIKATGPSWEGGGDAGLAAATAAAAVERAATVAAACATAAKEEAAAELDLAVLAHVGDFMLTSAQAAVRQGVVLVAKGRIR
ncbi:unnamed protein product, partial [Phaeothamnion confervicola]